MPVPIPPRFRFPLTAHLVLTDHRLDDDRRLYDCKDGAALAFSEATVDASMDALERVRLQGDVDDGSIMPDAFDETFADNMAGYRKGHPLRVLVASHDEAVTLAQWAIGADEEGARQIVDEALARCPELTGAVEPLPPALAEVPAHLAGGDPDWDGSGHWPTLRTWIGDTLVATADMDTSGALAPLARLRSLLPRIVVGMEAGADVTADLAEAGKAEASVGALKESLESGPAAMLVFYADRLAEHARWSKEGRPPVEILPVPELAPPVPIVARDPDPVVKAIGALVTHIGRMYAGSPETLLALAAGIEEGRSLTLTDPPEDDGDDLDLPTLDDGGDESWMGA